MKKSEYDTIIAKITNPDTQAEGLLELNDKLTADENEFAENAKSIADLRDSNQKLFLRATATPDQQDNQEEEQEDTLAKFENKLSANIGGK